MNGANIYETVAFASCPLTCQVISMGKDYTIAVYGGTHPHIGSTVMAQARPSLTGEGVSATSSVLNCVGHKEESVARMFAEEIAIRGNCTAVCTCGIHLDSATEDELCRIQEGCRALLDGILAKLD